MTDEKNTSEKPQPEVKEITFDDIKHTVTMKVRALEEHFTTWKDTIKAQTDINQTEYEQQMKVFNEKIADVESKIKTLKDKAVTKGKEVSTTMKTTIAAAEEEFQKIAGNVKAFFSKK